MFMLTAVVCKIPDSFVLWGEPTPPLEKPENQGKDRPITLNNWCNRPLSFI